MAGTGVLTVRAPRQGEIPGALGEIRQHFQDPRKLIEVDAVGLPKLEQLTGLGDVLGSRAPVNEAASVAVADAVQLPDQRYEAVTGPGQTLVDRVHIEKFEACLAGYFCGGI